MLFLTIPLFLLLKKCGDLRSRHLGNIETVRGPQERRNRIIHDAWLMDNENPTAMGRLELTAPKKLSFKAETILLAELQTDYDQIAKARNDFVHIRTEIYRVTPTLPKIPDSELHPIMNVR
jgi:hypothetical protein